MSHYICLILFAISAIVCALTEMELRTNNRCSKLTFRIWKVSGLLMVLSLVTAVIIAIMGL